MTTPKELRKARETDILLESKFVKTRQKARAAPS
jgi:hypothetical protein